MLIALLYRFGKRLISPKLGLTAAFFIAINPLHIWYANEARMYALYSLLAAGATYMLWRAISITERGEGKSLFWILKQRRLPPFYKYLAGYALLAGLTLYTNYTAVFLIAAQGMVWGWLFWKRGQLREFSLLGLLGILVVLPQIDDTIPRLFTGAESNFYFGPSYYYASRCVSASFL